MASELKARAGFFSDLTCSAKCGESNTYSGFASNPAVGVVTDRLVQMGGTMLFGDTSEITGGEHVLARRMATPELSERFSKSIGISRILMSLTAGAASVSSRVREISPTDKQPSKKKASATFKRRDVSNCRRLSPAEPPRFPATYF